MILPMGFLFFSLVSCSSSESSAPLFALTPPEDNDLGGGEVEPPVEEVEPPPVIEDGSCGVKFDPSGFTHRVLLTIDNSRLVKPLEQFPVLVRLPIDSEIYQLVARADGADLRFVDANTGHLLYHQIERFTTSSESFIWVRIPRITASQEVSQFLMYFGHPEASALSDSSKTFDREIFKAVYHFNEVFSGQVGEKASDVLDVKHMSTIIGEQIVSTEGKIAGGFSADETEAGFSVPMTSEELRSGSVTLLINLNRNYRDWRRVLSNESLSRSDEFSLAIASNSSRARLQLKMYDNLGQPHEWRGTTSVPSRGEEWSHLAYAWDFTTQNQMQPALYVNGSLEEFTMGQPVDGEMIVSSAPMCVYCRLTTQDRMPTGQHDELRIYHQKMSDEWIRTEFESYEPSFLSLGEIESLEN